MSAENIKVNITFKGPKILSKKIERNRMVLKLSWGSFGIGTTIIKKTNQGFSYEDVGLFKRNFDNVESMIWEFELPKELIKDIYSLKLS